MVNKIAQREAKDSITNGFQFARYERFSLAPSSKNKRLGHHHADYGKTRSGSAWSVADILREAAREPTDWKKHFPHVLEPQRPTVAYGCDPLEVEALAAHWITTVKQSNGKRMRPDTPSMIAGVISWPPHRPVEEFNEFLAYGVEKLKEIYGERLRSVVAHYDEITESQGALHYHFYVVPLDGEDFGVIDKAYAADKGERKRANSTDDEKKKKVDKYGKKYATGARKAIGAQVLVDWQDMIHDKISKKFGLLRTGPRRERWTRDETMLRLRVAESERKKKIAEDALLDAAEKQATIDEENEKIRLQQLELAYFESQREIEERALKEDFYTQLFEAADEKARREAEFDRRQEAIKRELVESERLRLAAEEESKRIIEKSRIIFTAEQELAVREQRISRFIEGTPSQVIAEFAEMELEKEKLKARLESANRKVQSLEQDLFIHKNKIFALETAVVTMRKLFGEIYNWIKQTNQNVADALAKKFNAIMYALNGGGGTGSNELKPWSTKDATAKKKLFVLPKPEPKNKRKEEEGKF